MYAAREKLQEVIDLFNIREKTHYVFQPMSTRPDSYFWATV
jgi:hypothetical protein